MSDLTDGNPLTGWTGPVRQTRLRSATKEVVIASDKPFA